MVDKELLDILACPVCKVEVRLEDDRIVCTKCGRRYPIKDDIPVMLIEEAETPPGADAPDTGTGTGDAGDGGGGGGNGD